MAIDKSAKIICYAVIATFIAAFISLAVATGVQRQKINEYRNKLETQCAVTDSLNRTVSQLWGQECIRVENTIQITQKGLVTVTQANNISRSVSEITRGELLVAMDSLKRVRSHGND